MGEHGRAGSPRAGGAQAASLRVLRLAGGAVPRANRSSVEVSGRHVALLSNATLDGTFGVIILPITNCQLPISGAEQLGLRSALTACGLLQRGFVFFRGSWVNTGRLAARGPAPLLLDSSTPQLFHRPYCVRAFASYISVIRVIRG